MSGLNPFDLTGPPFLVFYSTVAVLANAWLAYQVRRADTDRVPDPAAAALLRDSYMVAYLRGGAQELVRLALFGMTQRKLLGTLGRTVGMQGPGAMQLASNALERSILLECHEYTDAGKLVHSGSLRRAADAYAAPLMYAGLIADEQEYRRRAPAALLIGALLLGLALIKIAVAMSRGRSNIGLLIIVGVVALAVCVGIFRFHRTPLGNQALRHQQTLFGQLRSRVRRLVSQGATNEAIIVAAVFGLATLPRGAFPFAHRLAQSSSGSSSSDGSSCGGSGCGGGGGGCGGCGG